MKNKFKVISAFLLSIVLGFNVLSVNAADPYDDSVCGEGELLHTNYYLFLDVGDKATYLDANHAGSASGTWFHFTGAPKYNNINHNVTNPPLLIKKGEVKITNQDGTLANIVGDRDIVWTIAEYWENMYNTTKDLRYGKKSKNRTYDKDPWTTFFLHNGSWRSYKSENDETGTWSNEELYSGPVNSLTTDELYSYLDLYKTAARLATSDLVTKGTGLPETEIYSNDLSADLDRTYFTFRVKRTYTPTVVTNAPGFKLGNKNNVIYGPGVYYAQFCMKAPSKYIKYDQNYEGEAPANMPGTNTFNEMCTKISDKKPEREGYEFLGWHTDKDADKPAMLTNTNILKFAPNADYCDESITLYAIWKEKNAEEPEEPENEPFTVSYDANKGTDAPAPQSGDSANGTCIKISDKGKMTLAKNDFLGWSTKEDAAEADPKYAPGKEYCGENGNLKLYAVWSPKTGVSAHIIAFGIVAVSAIAALVVAKKKNLFKQI